MDSMHACACMVVVYVLKLLITLILNDDINKV